MSEPGPYLPALESVLGRRGRFGHREHLELAWLYVREHGLQGASPLMSAAIRHVARSHGAPDRYHHAITLTWLGLVAAHARRCDAATFDEFIERNPALLDGGLLARHFSSSVLSDPAARAGWVEPDLRALPVTG
jgi:hypothetical protein